MTWKNDNAFLSYQRCYTCAFVKLLAGRASRRPLEEGDPGNLVKHQNLDPRLREDDGGQAPCELALRSHLGVEGDDGGQAPCEPALRSYLGVEGDDGGLRCWHVVSKKFSGSPVGVSSHGTVSAGSTLTFRGALLAAALAFVMPAVVHATTVVQIGQSAPAAEDGNDQTRALTGLTTDGADPAVEKQIKKVAFTSSGGASGARSTMFVGLEGGAKKYALTAVTVDNSAAGVIVSQTPLAPDQASINGAPEAANPLNNKEITNLALLGAKTPVVTVDDKKLYLVDPSTAGKNIVQSIELKDAATNALQAAAQIPAIAATGGAVVYDTANNKSAPFVFAAVSQADKEWNDGLERGIAAVTYDSTKNPALTQVDPTGITAAANIKAAKLKTTIAGGSPIAFRDGAGGIDSVDINDNAVAMCWDDKLERLYVGLSDVERDGNNKEGGLAGVFMGYVDPINKAFNLAPIISGMNKDYFVPRSADNIVGLYANTNVGANCTVSGLRTMHTSTGKDYLIVATLIQNNNGEKKGVFALPLTSDVAGADLATKGVIGEKAADLKQPFVLLQAADAQRPTANDATKPWFTVAANEDITKLADMFVDGDTVYLCKRGDQNTQAGVFASSALFDEYGNIIAWTTPQRVMGYTGKVLGGGVDAYGNFYAATSKSQDPANAGFKTPTRVQISQWGSSDSVTNSAHALADNLSSVLADIFPAEQGGVHQIFNFNEQTPAF